MKPGIDFTGGAYIEISYNGVERPPVSEINNELARLELGLIPKIHLVNSFYSAEHLQHLNILLHLLVVSVNLFL